MVDRIADWKLTNAEVKIAGFFFPLRSLKNTCVVEIKYRVIDRAKYKFLSIRILYVIIIVIIIMYIANLFFFS